MLLETISQSWNKVRRTNATNTGFTVPVPTSTPPTDTLTAAASATAQEVVPCAGMPGVSGRAVQNIAQLLFYATGTNNQTFSARVYGWSQFGVVNNDPSKNLYVPVLIAEITSIILSSSLPGVAGCPVVSTELFADTATLGIGNTSKVVLTSPANDAGIACLDFDFTGFQAWEVRFSIAGGGVTDMNALYRMY